jgi:uncharacterized phage-associated protein
MLARASSEGRPMTQLKLQKLVYIAYGWYLALTGQRLFEEPIMAWKHGPVVESLFHEFKHFESDAITSPSELACLDDTEAGKISVTTPEVPKSDKDTQLILDKVWSAYKWFGAWALRNKTHEPGTPWSRTDKTRFPATAIDDKLIAPHFLEKIRSYLLDEEADAVG